MKIRTTSRLSLATAGLLLGLMITACAQAPDEMPSDETVDSQDSGIINGEPAKSSDVPGKSVVALVSQRQDGQALCTGTLLANDIVLTAAHCVEDSPEHLTLIFGSQIKNAPETNLREAVAFSQNPRWQHQTESGKGDLALIYFRGGVPKGFSPVKLANKKVKLTKGTEVLMMGYGVTDGNREIGAGVLRETQTSVIGSQSPTEIITDGHRSSVCFGDSGGPAFVKIGNKFLQWGVASSVMNQSCNEASIHTSILSYSLWIKSTMVSLRKKHHHQ